jgi:sec-independent protein translocase protein TatA
MAGILGGLGPWEILLIVGAILILFGAKKIPEFARSMGKGISEFKKGVKEGEESASSTSRADDSEPKPPARTTGKNSGSS